MPRKSFDDWFDRELAELKAGLEKLEASLEPRLPQPIATPTPTARPPGRPKKRAGGRARKAAVQRTPAPRPPAVEQAAAPEAVTPAPPAAAPEAATPAPATRSSSQETQPAPPPPPSPPPPPPRPGGADLSDPKNFGLEPPVGELQRGSSSSEDYRQRLTRHIAFSSRVLHTSGVPAAVWREWRAFERAAQERLRELNTRPPDPDLDA